jgi:hypothetical protein
MQKRLSEVGADLVAPEQRSSEYLGGFVISETEKSAGALRTQETI